MHQKPYALVIVGPTASGKSDLAIKLAQKFGGEVISADSRQVYKDLDAGTGKVTRDEMQGIPHHLLNIVDPQEQFSVYDYQNQALQTLRYIVISKKKLPIIVGGTGLYIDALTCATNFPAVPPNKLLRSELQKLSVEELFKKLLKKDPVRASSIDRHNKLRLIRALEIIDTLGQVPPTSNYLLPTTYNFIYIGLKPDKEVLEERIEKRLLERLPAIIKESQKLLRSKKLTHKRMYELGLEYRFVGMYLRGELGEEEMKQKLLTAIRQYAKRQMTWFKRNENIKWFKPEDYSEIEKYVKMALEKGD